MVLRKGYGFMTNKIYGYKNIYIFISVIRTEWKDLILCIDF